MTTKSKRSWSHPFATCHSDDQTHRSLTLRRELGSQASDLRLCEAVNRVVECSLISVAVLFESIEESIFCIED